MSINESRAFSSENHLSTPRPPFSHLFFILHKTSRVIYNCFSDSASSPFRHDFIFSLLGTLFIYPSRYPPPHHRTRFLLRTRLSVRANKYVVIRKKYLRRVVDAVMTSHIRSLINTRDMPRGTGRRGQANQFVETRGSSDEEFLEFGNEKAP